MDVVEILKSVETGASMGQLELLLAFGSVLGNLMAEGGAADCITTVFGKNEFALGSGGLKSLFKIGNCNITAESSF